MKKTFLRILPLAAAVLLATSCSKDNDNNDTELQPNPEPVVSVEESNTVTIPFRVAVKSGESLSKITYTPDGDSKTKVERKFVAGDKGTTMTVTSKTSGETAAIQSTTLTLDSDDEFATCYFSGTFEVLSDSAADFKDGKITLTGTFGAAVSEPTWNTSSLADLMTSCSHAYKATFVSDASDISLVDQNAYLAITMSVYQHKLDVTSGTKAECGVNNEGKVWVAVPSNQELTLNFLSKTAAEVQAGHIYTINRAGFVDLGTGDGTLWADANVTGGEGTGNNGIYYYTYEQAQALSVTLPSPTEINNLVDNCNWVNTTKGDLNGYIVYKQGGSNSVDNDPHIFIPAYGWIGTDGKQGDYNVIGDYWAEDDVVDDKLPRLFYNFGNNTNPRCDKIGSPFTSYSFSVRAVRRSANN